METAPRTAPNSSPETAVLGDNGEAVPKFDRIKFKHRGRRMTMFRRDNAPESPWYIHFEIDHQRYKKSLETNIQRRALERAKQYFDDIAEGKWADRQKKLAKVHTLAEALQVYKDKAGLYPSTVRNNIWALKFILRTLEMPTDPELVKPTDIDGSLNSRFQARLVEQYVSKARGESAKRSARELALRSSRSLLGQARSIFTKKAGVRAAYRAAEISLPPSIEEFISVPREGRSTKREYHAPSDAVIKETFAAIEEQKTLDPDLYKAFWIAVGAGLRRGEIRRLDWSHIIDRGGRLWVSGGIGKDGEVIEIRIQQRAAEKLAEFRKKSGPFVAGGDQPARRLNDWLEKHQWKTEKKIHELRAYIGSLLYQANPQAAKTFMRHKSIRVTETFYVHYGKSAQPVDVL